MTASDVNYENYYWNMQHVESMYLVVYLNTSYVLYSTV